MIASELVAEFDHQGLGVFAADAPRLKWGRTLTWATAGSNIRRKSA
jgi:hypothetical protein